MTEPRKLITDPQLTPLALWPLAISLGLFLGVTFILCVAFDLIAPQYAMYETWSMLLPGFTWLSFQSFVLGFVECFAYGLYVGFLFGSIYNLTLRISNG